MNTLDELGQIATSAQAATQAIHDHLPIVFSLLALLWMIHLINFCFSHRLNIFGVYPRHPFGVIGIVTSPLLHGNANHLFFNSIPFFILACMMLIFGIPNFICASLLIILISGFLTWLLGRRALHVGASGLIMGYWSYLLIAAIHQPGFITVSLGVVCIYYFAGFFSSMIPGQRNVSWEGHLFGFIAGIGANYLTPMVLTYLHYSTIT